MRKLINAEAVVRLIECIPGATSVRARDELRLDLLFATTALITSSPSEEALAVLREMAAAPDLGHGRIAADHPLVDELLTAQLVELCEPRGLVKQMAVPSDLGMWWCLNVSKGGR